MAQLGDTIIKGDLNVLGNINGNQITVDIKDFNTFDPKTLNMKAGDTISFASQNFDSNNYARNNCSATGFILKPRDDYQVYWLVSFATLNSNSIDNNSIFIRKYISNSKWSDWYTIPMQQFVG